MSVRAVSPTGSAPRDERAELRRMAHALESVFLNQLFQAMRASVPQEASSDGAAGELFTGMFDEQIAGMSAQHQSRGLGEALYHQLARRLDDASSPGAVEKGE